MGDLLQLKALKVICKYRENIPFICVILLLNLHCLPAMLQLPVALQPQLRWNSLLSVADARAQKATRSPMVDLNSQAKACNADRKRATLHDPAGLF